MKKLILLTFLIASSFQTINSQGKNNKDLIDSGKWYIEYAIINQQKNTLPESIKEENWIIFHSNKKMEREDSGIKSDGTWEFDTKTNIIKTTDNASEVLEMSVQELTKNTLTYFFTYKGNSYTIGLKK